MTLPEYTDLIAQFIEKARTAMISRQTDVLPTRRVKNGREIGSPTSLQSTAPVNKLLGNMLFKIDTGIEARFQQALRTFVADQIGKEAENEGNVASVKLSLLLQTIAHTCHPLLGLD